MKRNIIIITLLITVSTIIFIHTSPAVVTVKKEAPQKEVVTETTEQNHTVYKEKKEISSVNNYNNQYKSSEDEKLNEPTLKHYTSYPQHDNHSNHELSHLVPRYVPEETRVVQMQKSPLEQHIEMCKPYTETMRAEYMGMLIDYELYIRGWINDKCVIDFISRVKGTGNSFKDTYNINPDEADIFAFAPEITCKFTKQDLLYVGDSILEENQHQRNMLKDPNQIKLPSLQNFSQSDTRLFEIVMGNKACEITNGADLTDMIENLFKN